MKNIFASHTTNLYLKPGEVVVTCEQLLVSTILGSCVSVTMFSPSRGFGAICHAMLPENNGRGADFRYLDTALEYLYSMVIKHSAQTDLVVKLFGGAHLLEVGDVLAEKCRIGDQNVSRAEEILSSLGLKLDARDTGGKQGRKLFFSTHTGEVYVRRMRLR